jgi:hypothetical protein
MNSKKRRFNQINIVYAHFYLNANIEHFLILN